MKITFKRSMSVLAISCALFLQGCGGGGTGGNGGNGGGNDSADRDGIGGADGKFKYDRVTIAGSSITYGGMGAQGGLLGERSYVGEVEKYLREELADTINPTELKSLGGYNSTTSELLSYQGELIIYGSGSTISGTLEASDEMVIVYGGSNAVVEMAVDGTVCGTKTISGSFKPEIIEHPGASGIEPNLLDPVTIDSFRRTNDNAVAKICTGLENKAHNFTLTVKSGELHLNFITNHMYYMQNAGIGGYRASDLLTESARTADTTTDQIVDFKPDLFILESATNDAQPWGQETDSTNSWKIESPTECSIENNIVKDLSISGIAKGDVVVIGDYNGDIKTMAVGIVSKIDGSDIVLESNVISYGGSDMNGTRTNCRVKNISSWVSDVTKVVERVKAGSPNVVVGIGTSGVPNYWPPTHVINPPQLDTYAGKSRRLLGYREVGKNLATEKGWMFFDFFKATMAVNSGVDEAHDDEFGNEILAKWSIGDNTHPNAAGNIIFGKAITDVLKTQ